MAIAAATFLKTGKLASCYFALARSCWDTVDDVWFLLVRRRNRLGLTPEPLLDFVDFELFSRAESAGGDSGAWRIAGRPRTLSVFEKR